MITSRRSFLTGLTATLITAPAIVRAGSLMPVKQLPWIGVDLAAGPDVTAYVYYFQERRFWFYDGSRIVHFSEPQQEYSWTPMTS